VLVKLPALFASEAMLPLDVPVPLLLTAPALPVLLKLPEFVTAPAVPLLAKLPALVTPASVPALLTVPRAPIAVGPVTEPVPATLSVPPETPCSPLIVPALVKLPAVFVSEAMVPPLWFTEPVAEFTTA